MSHDPDDKPDLEAVGRAFGGQGHFRGAARLGSGHINDTYLATWDGGRLVHQRINHLIFKNPAQVMENIQRVTEHQRHKLRDRPARVPPRQALTCLPSVDGSVLYRDRAGNYWRSYVYLEGARSYDVCETPRQAFIAARAFGDFQEILSDLGGERLHETIPQFHDTPWRLDNLERAAAADSHDRVRTCREELHYALEHRAEGARLLELHRAGRIPERITHNDTKLNNVMLDEKSGEDVCVIDLDTVMPGLAVYDFGDMVRTATMPVKEDERDLSKVIMQWPMFEALVRGYLVSAGEFLNTDERAQLAFSGWLLTFEVGTRFLTDYLSGDSYFRISRDNQNLDRARAQFALARDIEKNLPEMDRLVASL
jgi:Ser/Thr protein kinase RdoA (MazF antagonist)